MNQFAILYEAASHTDVQTLPVMRQALALLAILLGSTSTIHAEASPMRAAESVKVVLVFLPASNAVSSRGNSTEQRDTIVSAPATYVEVRDLQRILELNETLSDRQRRTCGEGAVEGVLRVESVTGESTEYLISGENLIQDDDCYPIPSWLNLWFATDSLKPKLPRHSR